jgi:ABC-2 type transport system ATP-binding protein
MPTPLPTVRLDRLGRRFGDHWAVRDLSLEVVPGEIIGLLGPNGAGKTTTVRMLAALISPSEGRAWLDGIDVTAEPEAVRARVGVLTEVPGLYEKLSAQANLDFFGRLHSLPADVRSERIERFLRLFDLWDRRAEATATFSKGMKQKLAIARALLHDPSVVFLDEPTAALDPEAAFVVRDAIESLRGSGRTVVLCTHNLSEAERLCDRIAFVRGTLLRVDSPARLRAGLGDGRVRVRLAAAGPAVEVARSVSGVTAVEANDGEIVASLADPDAVTPTLVAALVEAGAAILEVRREAATLEEVYFEVMGVRPGAGGEAT